MHQICRRALVRKSAKVKLSVKNKGKAKHAETWKYETLPKFDQPKSRMCGFCKEFPTPPHNSLTCPLRLDHDQSKQRAGRPKKPLMNLADRRQGKERIKPLLEFFENYCETNDEDKKDILAFEYRRELNKSGEYRAAKTFEKFHKKPSLMLVQPLSPRKTASRSVMSGLSWNKSREQYTYMSQHGLPVLAGPGETDLYRWSISPMNVSYSMESIDHKFKSEYKAPEQPTKPTKENWTNRHERSEEKKLYARKLTAWKNKLRPVSGSHSLGAPTAPEAVKPNIVSASYPYPNVLAHSIYDSREIILKKLEENKVKPGILKVHTHASDGCDGFGDWDLCSNKTNVDLPDHGLSYDCKILRIECEEANLTLFEDSGASVSACRPILRAAANENDHFSTHMLTIPIERQRSAMEKVVMTVALNEDYTLETTFEIDPSKVDLKYNFEQSGLGDRNFGCHLCTIHRSKWFEKESILAGFPLNRTLSGTVEEAERRRINPDGDTQANLKEASKGVTHAPIYQAEHSRHLVDPLHCGLSLGRALVDLIVRFNCDVFSRTIEASVKPTYDATQNELKERFLQIVGFSPFSNLAGTEVATLFKLDNHENVLSMIPEVHQTVFEHWLTESRFFLGFLFHMDPHDTFDLDQVQTRFEALLIFAAEEMGWWSPPDYCHIGLSHVVQILQLKNDRGNLKYKNLNETGTQDKEHKNKKQRLFFKSFSRKNSNQNAIIDVLIRDMEESSLEMREHGLPKPVHKCGDCAGLGHHRNSKKCPKVQRKGKFLDLTREERYLNKTDSGTDCSVDSDISEDSQAEDDTIDSEVVVDETMDDFELQEAVEDMVMDSPFKQSEVDMEDSEFPTIERRRL